MWSVGSFMIEEWFVLTTRSSCMHDRKQAVWQMVGGCTMYTFSHVNGILHKF